MHGLQLVVLCMNPHICDIFVHVVFDTSIINTNARFSMQNEDYSFKYLMWTLLVSFDQVILLV